jgi:hypothetical protein
MPLEFDSIEEETNELLLEFMTRLREWGLKYNQDEMARAIHTLQMFVFQHALQRTGSLNGGWYAD